MKLLFFILGFLMLYLSFLPCGDSKDCNVKATVAAISNDHQQHNHDAESCTPFCTCSCCAASVFYSTLTKTQSAKVTFQSAQYPLYYIGFSTQLSCSIWQPPKTA